MKTLPVEIHEAIVEKNDAKIQEIMKEEGWEERMMKPIPQYGQRTAFETAVQLGQMAMVNHLWKHAGQQGIDRQKIIQKVMKSKHHRMMKNIIEECSIEELNQKDSKGKVPFMEAVHANNSEAVKQLKYIGVDMGVKDENQWTALQVAVQQGNQTIVKELLGLYQKNQPIDGNHPIMLATKMGDEQMVQYLIDQEDKGKEKVKKHFLAFWKKGYRETYDCLKNATHLVNAAAPYTRLAKKLIKWGAPYEGANAHGQNILHHLAKIQNITLLEYIGKKKKELFVLKPITVLHAACEAKPIAWNQLPTGHLMCEPAKPSTAMLDRIIKLGGSFQLYEKDERHYTPIHVAAAHGNTTLVMHLHQIYHVALDREGFIPVIQVAIDHHQLATVRFLLPFYKRKPIRWDSWLQKATNPQLWQCLKSYETSFIS